MIRRGTVLATFVAAAVCTTAACGAENTAAPGSRERPLVAKPTDPSTSSDADRLNEAQSSAAAASGQPQVCELVTATEARRVLGSLVGRPVVAPQGPSCVYRGRTPKGEDPRKSFVSLAIQHREIADARRQLTHARRVAVGGRPGFCGQSGQPMLFVEVSDGQVLGIVGPCAKAKRFAELALKRINA